MIFGTSHKLLDLIKSWSTPAWKTTTYKKIVKEYKDGKLVKEEVTTSPDASTRKKIDIDFEKIDEAFKQMDEAFKKMDIIFKEL